MTENKHWSASTRGENRTFVLPADACLRIRIPLSKRDDLAVRSEQRWRLWVEGDMAGSSAPLCNLEAVR